MDITNISQKYNRNLVNNSQSFHYPVNINNLNYNDIPYANQYQIVIQIIIYQIII